MVAFAPDGGEVFRYRKRHPWYPEVWATPGQGRHPVVEIDGLRVTIATCFDIHFMKSEAAAELAEADLLLFPSAWVEQSDSRPSMLPSLAQTFTIAIANANWGAGSPRVDGQGGSRIYAGDGVVVAEARAGRADAVIQPRSRA
jgi:predicted amidohydrolase